MKKLTTTLVVLCLASFFMFASGGKEPAGAAAPASSGIKVVDGVKMINDNIYAEGDKIAKNPITLDITVVSGSHVGPMASLTWIKQLQQDTNIKINFNHINSGNTTDQRNLIFATQDYPDIFWGAPTDQQIADCAEAGAIYPLNDLIDKYAPNWKKYLAEHPDVRKLITSSDGKIYSLPIVFDDIVQTGIRDQWLINKVWLDQLGLKVPATETEFLAVMRAFKANAGKGAIPAGAIPYYFRYNYYIGSQLDFYAAYGVIVPGDRDIVYLSVNPDGKTVEYNFTDKAIMRPVNMLNTMYKEGLVPGAVFTDEWNEYLAKTRATPAFVGSFHSFHNPDPATYVAMPPFKVEGVQKGYIRSQLNGFTRNYFTIFKKNKFPEASIRLADVIANPERSLTGFYGQFGKYLVKQGDKILQLPQQADEQMKNDSPGNCLSLLITKEVADTMIFDGALKVRQEAVQMYKPYILPTERMYPRLMIPAHKQARYSELQTYINNLTKERFATWITKGGIEAGWNQYLKDLEAAGLKEYLQLSQEFFDSYKKL